MDILYTVMENMLDDEYKLNCIKNILSAAYDKAESITHEELLSVITVSAEALGCVLTRYRSNISALDKYIADNASELRKSEPVIAQGTDEQDRLHP